MESILTSLPDQHDVNLDHFYRQMMTMRIVEESLLRLFSEGLLNGTVHTCLGQEACAAGVISALDCERDILFSNHRCHGHYLAYCDDIEGLIAELMGRETGVCGGVGGSQHLQKNNFYSNGILGGIAPVATGMAYAEKIKESGAIAVVFIGDGAYGEGVVYESLNMAGLWSVPLLVVSELNGYAQSTPTHLEHSGQLEARGVPFGIPVTTIEATDVTHIYRAAHRCVDAIRRQGRPQILCLKTYRLGPHSKGDDNRDSLELEFYRKEDPLLRLQQQVDPARQEQIEREINERVAQAIEQARHAPIADFFLLEAQWQQSLI